jgi:ATP-dependent Clp protease adaptor protein ClpS
MNPLPPDPSSRPDAPRSQPLPPYRVVLTRETCEHELMGIVRAVMDVTHLCREEATHKMWESYHRGRSQLLVTHKERAELYVDQFAHHGITVTIEPVSA